MDHTSRKSCPGKSVEHNEILRQITEQLAEIHSREEVHGKHPSSLAEVLDSAGKLDISNESLSEWRPAEETKTDSKPTKEGDVFSLGCYFYHVITGGQHPFGRSGQRAVFIEKNLCNLAGCRDKQVQRLITRMISHDCTKRPDSSELLNHPFLWHSKKTEEYLTNVAENIDESSDQYHKWKGTILLSDKSIGVNRGQKKTAAVKVTNVAAVLKEIKEKKANPTDLCQMFPNLLPSVYNSENAGSNEIEQEIDESRPEIFNDLLIANGNFGEVESVMKVKRRHGRLGLQHVHVIQFQKDCDDTALASERLRYLNHPNCLQCFYLVENSLETCMAFEPFNETLETWLEKRERAQLEWEIINDILRQITKGLVHYHANKLTHGNLSLSQIVIFEKESAIIAKVATLELSHVKYSPETLAATMKNDIRELGQIFSYLLSESRQEISQSHVHLIRAMKELALPSAASVLKHPFLWSLEMTAAFLLAAGDYYVQHPNFDKTSKLDSASLVPLNPDHRNLTTNREALQAFSLQTSNLTLEERKSLVVEWTNQFSKLVLQTWLRLQKFKEVSSDEDLDLSSFYHPNYDFPAYDELMYDEKNIDIRTDDRTPPQNLEFGKSEIQSLYLENYIKRKSSKRDQETSSSMKYIDNLFIRTSPLHVACQSDEFYESATALMDLGFNPNEKDLNGFAPLHVAVDKKAVKIVQLLIKNNAKLDIRDEKYQITPIFFAANNNSVQIITLFIENKAKINLTDPNRRNPLHFAVKNNSLDAAKILLENGADVNARDAFGNSSLHIAVDLNLVDMVKLLLSYKANPNIAFPVLPNADITIECVLHLAVVKNSPDMVEVLLNAGADPNQKNRNGETALHFAAAAHTPNRLRIVDLLIKKGAKPNVVDKCNRTVLFNAMFNKVEDVAKLLLELDCSIEIVNQQEIKTGLAPLHLAAWHKFADIAAMLIVKEAKVNIEDRNGLTPLEFAAASNAVHVAKRLLESDAEAISRYQTQNIRSPLHVAAAYDALQVGELLISLGADINSVDKLDLTPLHYAAFCNSTRFIKFLKAKQENLPNASASDVSDERHLRKPRRNSKHYHHQQRRDQQQQPLKLGSSQQPKQQENRIPYLSKNLSAEELASIPQLMDCFASISWYIQTNFQKNLPSYITQFPNTTLTITQVMNVAPGYV